MKSVKHVKQSPSALAFSSPSKRRVISELVATRNIIKNKFKRAYMERIEREREMSEALKPITQSIATLKSSKESQNVKREKNQNDSIDDKLAASKVSSFKPEHLVASTPKVEQKDFFLKFQPSTMRDADDEQHPTTSRNINKKLRKTKPKPKLKLPGRSRSLSSSAAESGKILERSIRMPEHINTRNYTFEVEHDDDLVNNYNKDPNDNLEVMAMRTSTKTGEMTPVRMKWSQLPQPAKDARLKERHRISKFLATPVVQKVFSKDRRRIAEMTRTPTTTDDDETFSPESSSNSIITSNSSQAKRTGGKLNTNDSSLDFNFIPYSRNNRIIYEYFDDPNELCDRLRLLVSSRIAGNTNHMQEINSIIEELRELGCIV